MSPKNMTSVLLPFLALMFLAGCVTSRLPDTIAPDKLTEHGLMVGSISRGQSAQDYFRYAVHYREIGSTKDNKIYIQQPPFHAPFNDDFPRGNLFAISLPPGNHEFYNFYAESQHEYGLLAVTSTYWRAAEDFSMPFVVEQGKITYVGEITLQATEKEEEKFLGGTVKVADAPHIYTADQRKRDIPLLKQKYPNLDWGNISYQILKMP